MEALVGEALVAVSVGDKYVERTKFMAPTQVTFEAKDAAIGEVRDMGLRVSGGIKRLLYPQWKDFSINGDVRRRGGAMGNSQSLGKEIKSRTIERGRAAPRATDREPVLAAAPHREVRCKLRQSQSR